MINDIVDYIHISNGSIRLKKQTFSLYDAITEVSKLIKFQAKKKGLKVLLDIKKNLSHESFFINNDAGRVKQVILNLMNNAVKYTERGEINISLEEGVLPGRPQTTTKTNEKAFLIRVSDTGIGIKQEDLVLLLQRQDFREDDGIRRKGVSGLGLGLIMCKKHLEILNGEADRRQLQIHSEYGKGSTFSFIIKSSDDDLPEEDVHTENEEILGPNQLAKVVPVFKKKSSSQSNIGGVERERPMILLVDDDQINITVGSSYLRSFKDFQFDTAFNGSEALEKVKNKALKSQNYALILMDCNMPVMDGLQATVEINKLIKSKQLPRVPIIACTANASLEDKEKCLEAGMCDILIKPFSKHEMEMKIKKHFFM